MKTRASFKKGHKPTYTKTGKEHSQYVHGMGSTKNRNPLYQKWSGIKRRCFNKNEKCYPRYGGAGVVLSKEWMDFRNFYKDMASSYFPGASIDRIDNSKGYSKENCRWVTIDQQNKNKRNVPLYKLGNLEMTSSDWDRKLGLKIGAVRSRIKHYGWPVYKALTTPKKTYKGFSKDSRGLFRVEVKVKGKRYFVGRYKSGKEAFIRRQEFLANLLA